MRKNRMIALAALAAMTLGTLGQAAPVYADELQAGGDSNSAADQIPNENVTEEDILQAANRVKDQYAQQVQALQARIESLQAQLQALQAPTGLDQANQTLADAAARKEAAEKTCADLEAAKKQTAGETDSLLKSLSALNIHARSESLRQQIETLKDHRDALQRTQNTFWTNHSTFVGRQETPDKPVSSDLQKTAEDALYEIDWYLDLETESSDQLSSLLGAANNWMDSVNLMAEIQVQMIALQGILDCDSCTEEEKSAARQRLNVLDSDLDSKLEACDQAMAWFNQVYSTWFKELPDLDGTNFFSSLNRLQTEYGRLNSSDPNFNDAKAALNTLIEQLAGMDEEYTGGSFTQSKKEEIRKLMDAAGQEYRLKLQIATADAHMASIQRALQNAQKDLVAAETEEQNAKTAAENLQKEMDTYIQQSTALNTEIARLTEQKNTVQPALDKAAGVVEDVENGRINPVEDDEAYDEYNRLVALYKASSSNPDTPSGTEKPVRPSGSGGGSAKPRSIKLYRLYNPNSGEHFYTASAQERDHLISLTWRDEDIGWESPETSNRPVYRLYNANAGDHHYTVSAGERDALKQLGWKDEGIGWYSAAHSETPLYRQYNPNAKAGSHNYTVNKAEHDYLVSLGWKDEGIAWHSVK